MTFAKKKLPKSQIVIEVQIGAEELERYKEGARSALAKNLSVEGFRPGHVPLSVAEKRLGETAIFREAARLAVAQAYGDIVERENLDVIGEPQVQVLKLAQGNPLEFRIRVALLPDIQLPDYKKIASEATRKIVVVEEKEVDDTLQWLCESRKTKDGVIPEATNEFAKSLGNFADLTSLRASLREGLRYEKELREKDRLRQEIVERIAEQSKLEIPDVLVEREKQALLSQVKQNTEQVLQMRFEEYLQKAGKTEQELLDSFAPEAEQRVKRFLVVREVGKEEGIRATQEEVEQEVHAQRVYLSSGQTKQNIDVAKLKEYTEGVLRYEKTLQFLESMCKA